MMFVLYLITSNLFTKFICFQSLEFYIKWKGEAIPTWVTTANLQCYDMAIEFIEPKLHQEHAEDVKDLLKTALGYFQIKKAMVEKLSPPLHEVMAMVAHKFGTEQTNVFKKESESNKRIIKRLEKNVKRRIKK